MAGPYAIKHGNRAHLANTEAAIRNRQPFTVASVQGVQGLSFQPGRLTGDALAQWHDDRTDVDYTVYSYSTPIAWHRDSPGDPAEGMWVLVFDKFSVTTSQHLSRIRSAITGLSYEIAGE